MLVVNIPSQILLIILLFIDYSLWYKLKIDIIFITHTQEKLSYDKLIFCKIGMAITVKRVNKI